MVKTPTANAGDTGSILDLGRSHMMQGDWACTPHLTKPALLSLRGATVESMCSSC